MKVHRLIVWPPLFALLLLSTGLSAQNAPECVKVATTKRPNSLLTGLDKLNAFASRFEEDVRFKDQRIVKVENRYYLIAAARNSDEIWAFELEQKGKRLFLNREFEVQSCSEGELSLDTFLETDDRIGGCRIGTHRRIQLQND